MSIFTDRRPLRQIGGLKAYLRQVSWSLRWQLEWRRRVRRTLGEPRMATGSVSAGGQPEAKDRPADGIQSYEGGLAAGGGPAHSRR